MSTSAGQNQDHTQILLPEIDSNDETSKSQHNEAEEIRQMSSFTDLNDDLEICPSMNAMDLPTAATFEQLYLAQQSLDDEFAFSNMEFQDFLPFQSNSSFSRAEEMTSFPLDAEELQQWYIPASSDPLQTAEYDAFGFSSLE
jgi:hypothetical protein